MRMTGAGIWRRASGSASRVSSSTSTSTSTLALALAGNLNVNIHSNRFNRLTSSWDLNLARSFTISSISRSTITSTTTTADFPPSSPPPPPSSSSPSSTPSTPSSSSIPSSSPYRSSPQSLAIQILKTSWLPSNSQTRIQLQDFVNLCKSASSKSTSPSTETVQPPDFLFSLFETIRSYRAVRSRLWVPESVELFKANRRFQSHLQAKSNPDSDSKKQPNPLKIINQLLSIGQLDLPQPDSKDGNALQEEEAEGGKMSDSEREKYLSKLYRETFQLLNSEEQKGFQEMDPLEQEDLIYRKVWSCLTTKERESAMSRVKFECIRKLGWRKGFTSGFPIDSNTTNELEKELLEKRMKSLNSLLPRATPAAESEERTLEILEAKKSLFEMEEKAAFEAWKQMPPSVRREEEKAAWASRDRGRLFISGGTVNPRSVENSHLTTRVLGAVSPRWYPEPVKAGQLIYLPNTIVRLVKNHTKPNEPYDAYKATFRIPYSMHKHALKNYLLSIYGLRITWIRTMIYRSSRARSAPGGSRELRDRGFGRRNFKKTEVGLLEPFLFPEIGEKFLRQGLLGDEMEVERMAGMIKLRGGKRWRSTRLPDIYEDPNQNVEQMGSTAHQPQSMEKDQESRETLSVESDGVQGNEIVTRNVEKVGKKNRLTQRPRLLVRSGGIPTAKHSRILQMLGWKNEEREEKIREIMENRKSGTK